MECLEDYIGIFGCGASVPAGGKYINTLPGISLESIETLADDEQKNYFGVWSDVQERALSKFPIDVNDKFAARYKIKQVRSSSDILRNVNTQSTHASVAGIYRGVSMELTVKNSQFVSSNLQSLFVQEFSFFIIDKTQITTSIIVKVFDLNTLEELDSFTVLKADISDGWNQKVINKQYDRDRIAIVFDGSEITCPSQPIPQMTVNGFVQSVSVVYGGYANPFVRGVAFTNASSPTFGTDSFGLTAVFSVVCKYDNLVCANKMSFIYPLWYLMGAELMIERLNSTRLNTFTTIEKDKAATLYQDFMAEYNRSLTQIVDSISLDLSDACLECNAPIRYVETRM